MARWWKVVLVAVLVGLPAFLLGPALWPISPDFPVPAPEQMPFFILLSVFDSLFLGLGIAFILFGWPLIRRMPGGSGALRRAVYLSIVFLLVSWWPHINLHNAVGFDLQGLLYIDYAFHIPLMISGGIVAYGFLNLFRQSEVIVDAADRTPVERATSQVPG
ncbi:MAG TPA: hypothetical protein VFI11_01305 [Anaerolineales bacterium]|nr:hypothetical protein [Anaerolineales bacterium]